MPATWQGVVCNIGVKHEHATRDVRTRQALTHRRGVRDRAPFELDVPIEHANHTAAVLTADALTLRRTYPGLGARYRHGVEQRGALGHKDHAAAAIGLRTSASHRRSATKKPTLNPIEQGACGTCHRSHHMAVRYGRRRVADATCDVQTA
jgi:predicted CXXCH cytochrome family protein